MSRVTRSLSFCFSLVLVFTCELRAQLDTINRPAPKWQVRTQAAGYQGLVSVGGGPLLFKGVWRPGLMYGWSHSAEMRTAVHTTILRNDIVLNPLLRKGPWTLAPTLNANLLFDTGDHSFLVLPDNYPKGYYRTTAVHATFGLGGRVGYAIKGGAGPRQIGLSVELVTLDTYAYWALIQREIPFSEAISLAIAVDVMF